MLLLSIATFVVIEIVALVVVAIRSPRDVKAPFDQRDRLIALKAKSLAWYVWFELGLDHFLDPSWANEIGIAYCVLISFVVALAVNYAARIAYYRRGL